MPITVAVPYVGHNQDMINPFIKKFVGNIQICNRAHYRACIESWGYPHHNLFYGEREIYSLMAAAMHKITPIHQSESRTTKRRDRRNPRYRGMEQDASGRVDLWAYKDEIEHYFEFKRSYVGINSFLGGRVPDRIDRPWTNLVEQVNQARNGPYLREEPNTCCIGMQIITPYKRGRNESRLLSQEPINNDEIIDFIGGFRSHPSAVLWYRSDSKSRLAPIEWDDETDDEIRWVFHPCHLFLFTIRSQ